MANLRLTLRITRQTNVALAVEKLEQVLNSQGISNPQLSKLLFDTALRFQTELASSGVTSSNTGSARSNVARTVIRGEGYRICVTTRPETSLSRLADRVLRRPATIS